MLAAVRGADLKSCFIDMSTLLKKYDRAKVFGIHTERDSITFTCDTGTCYSRKIDLKPGKDFVSMDITVLFADLSHFIPAKADITLDITEYYVGIITPKSNMTLHIGESIVPQYKERGGTIIDLDYKTLRSSLQVFSGTSDLQKAFSRDFAISYYGEHAVLRSPTMWIRTKSQGLNCVLSMDQLKSIVTFKPEFVEESDRLEFKKGDAILSVPKMLPTDEDKMPALCHGMKLYSVIELGGIIKELLEVKKSIGVADADIHLHQNGFNLNVTKNGISLTEDYNAEGDSVFSFRYMIDLFIMCLNILGEEEPITIKGKEDLICLENTDTSILMSV